MTTLQLKANSRTPAELKNCKLRNPFLFGPLARYLGSDKRQALSPCIINVVQEERRLFKGKPANPEYIIEQLRNIHLLNHTWQCNHFEQSPQECFTHFPPTAHEQMPFNTLK